jgi:hypothetical protein
MDNKLPVIGRPVADLSFQVFHNEEMKKVSLDDYRGKWLVLFFYPADFTFVCPTELEDMADAQAQLNEAYDSFVKTFGYIHSKANRQAFADDPNAPFLRALEHYNPETETATKARIFKERTIRQQSVPTSVASVADVLVLSLNQWGFVDLVYMAQTRF